MTRPTDPQPGTSEHYLLRQSLLNQRRTDRARWARLDAQFEASDKAIAALVERERNAQSDAVPAADPPDDPPAGEPAGEPAAETIPPPASLDELAAASALGSPAHMEWRRQHSSPDRGLFA